MVYRAASYALMLTALCLPGCALFEPPALRELSDIEESIFEQLNFARNDPKSYAESVLITYSRPLAPTAA
ncbi:hypothetical protein [Ferrimonas pelagia]|uniref:Uncharacterized protein n=1 Tax=Ferrimonas pelagia TaxID=1177826 RepID=A0ABP9FI12_9GAMM